MLTNELFQQLVNLLAMEWIEQNTVLETFGHIGLRIVRDVTTPAAAAAADTFPAAVTSMETKDSQALKPMLQIVIQNQGV